MEHEFERIPISKLVLRLGIPAMCAQFFNILYSIVDRAFVGHLWYTEQQNRLYRNRISRK